MAPALVDAYRPIDCSLHDRFEAAAVRRDPVRIEWCDTDSATHTTEGLIRDVVVRDGAEFLKMSDGSQIRLDRVSAFEIVR